MKLLLVIALVALARTPSEACTCRAPTVEISPSGTDVPINATIMLFVPERFVKYGGDGGKLSFLVRDPRGKGIALTAKYTGSGKTDVVELIPKQPLAAGTAYEVVIKLGGKVVKTQTFTTGRTRAKTAPAWKAQGIAGIRYINPAMCGAGSCMNCVPLLEVTWFTDAAAPERVRVGIWVGSTIDLSKPPTTYVVGVATREILGDRSYCASSTLTIPNDPKLKFAARLFDEAGNASEVREVTVDTTKPVAEY